MYYNVVRFVGGASTIEAEETPKLRVWVEDLLRVVASTRADAYPSRLTIWAVCAPVGTKLGAARSARFEAQLRELGSPEEVFRGCPLGTTKAEDIAYVEATVADDTCVMVSQWCPLLDEPSS
jgi:hypothetical protein